MASAFFRSFRVSSTAPSRRSFVGLSLLVGVGVPVLAGCDVLSGMSKGGDVSASSDSASAGSSSAASGSASASGGVGVGSTDWQELDAHIMGHNVAVRVSPVIRKDETTSIMALELTRAEDDASIDDVKANSYSDNGNKLGISHYLGAPSIFRPGAGADLVKLLDLEGGRVWSATDGGGGFLDTTPGEKVTSYLSFGKVDTDQVTVLVPMAGFTTVSVLEADAAKKADIDLSAASSGVDKFPGAATELAEPVAIERYTRALDDSTSTQVGGDDVTVTLASDVTFASDSADLASGAEAQLQTVSGQLAQYPDGGTLTIVGHTDDIQDDAYNQTLSEKRADAVKTRLEQLTSLDKWQTSVTGKGESEPRVKDTTDEARAANRRVEITLTPTGGTTNKGGSPTAAPTGHPRQRQRWFAAGAAGSRRQGLRGRHPHRQEHRHQRRGHHHPRSRHPHRRLSPRRHHLHRRTRLHRSSASLTAPGPSDTPLQPARRGRRLPANLQRLRRPDSHRRWRAHLPRRLPGRLRQAAPAPDRAQRLRPSQGRRCHDLRRLARPRR